jgi:hypothetical protein
MRWVRKRNVLGLASLKAFEVTVGDGALVGGPRQFVPWTSIWVSARPGLRRDRSERRKCGGQGGVLGVHPPVRLWW